MNKEIIIPKHVAIILDGNGRWAKQRGLPRNLGHRKGALNLRDITNSANKLGVKQLTVYAFSTENWNRPKQEVDYLMKTPIKYYKKYKDKIVKINVKVTFIGRRDRFSSEFLQCMEEIEDLTKSSTGINLNIAIDYGSKNEIVTAIKEIATDVKTNKLTIDEIDEKIVDEHLFTKGMYPIDLLIRTSGEVRLSNYLLWQLAYSEFYFTKTYWPDFNEAELLEAIKSYQKRERRFGGLKK
ncbi:MAG: isoprenyl transferase [bacterium]